MAAWVEGDDAPQVEFEDVQALQILGFVIIIAVLIGLVVIALFQYTDRSAQAALATAVSRNVYPELRENRLHAQQLLSRYEALEGGQGVYRIPIERAMERLVQEAGLGPESGYAAEFMILHEDR